MAEPETGIKPTEQQTQQPDVMPTQGQTGTKTDPSVMPTDKETPIIEDDPTIEKDGQKVVPFDSYKAEKEKRQEYEAKLRELEEQRATPKEPDEKPPAEEVPDINWDELLGLNQPTQPSQPAQQHPVTQSSQPSPDALREFNESLREQRESGDEIGALYRAGLFFQAQQDAMRSAAKKVVKDYDNLPLHTVGNTEIQFFQQNPEALRAVLAKVKGSRATTTQSPSQPTPSVNNAPPANWEELQEKLRQEGREEALRGIAPQAGTSFESSRASSTPSGEAYELDDFGKNYARRRGIPEEKWPEFAKQLHSELEGRF